MLKLVQKIDDANLYKAPEEVLLTHLEVNGQPGLDPAAFELSTGRKCRLVLGRGSATLPVDVQLNAKRDGKEIISRQHAEIYISGGSSSSRKHIVRDMNSMNGVFVNNLCIDEHELKEGDLIQFGGVAKVPVGHLISSTDVCLKYVYISTSNKDFESALSRHVVNIQGLNELSSPKHKNGSSSKVHSTSASNAAPLAAASVHKTASNHFGSAATPISSATGTDITPSLNRSSVAEEILSLDGTARLVDNNDGVYYKLDSNSPILPKKNKSNSKSFSNNIGCTNIGNSDSNNNWNINNNGSSGSGNISTTANNNSNNDSNNNSNNNSSSNNNNSIENSNKIEAIKPRRKRRKKDENAALVFATILNKSQAMETNSASSQSDSLIKSRSDTLRRFIDLEDRLSALKDQNHKLQLKLNNQESMSQHKLGEKLSEIESLKALNESILEEKSKVESSLNNKQQELADQMEENFKLKKSSGSATFRENTASSSSSSPATPLIDHSSLRTSLCCAICSEPILDAAILECSHGFCISCIELHWEWHTDFIMNKTKASISRSSIVSNKTLCPSCNTAFPGFNKEAIIHHASSSSIPIRGNDAFGVAMGLERLKNSIRKWRLENGLSYYRSSHIDNLVWLLIEASLPGEQESFKSRERQHTDALKRLKLLSISKQATGGATQRLLHDDDDEREDSDDGASDGIADIDYDGNDNINNLSSNSSSRKNNNNSNNSNNNNRSSKFGSDNYNNDAIQRKKHKSNGQAHNAGSSDDVPTCGYCLERGHEDHECPFDENNK